MPLRTLHSAILLAVTTAASVPAQATTGPTAFYGAPGARRLGTVAAGTVLAPGDRSGEFVQVRLHGYVAVSLLGGARDSFPVSVNTTDVRLRAAPSTTAPVVATVDQGMGLRLVKRSAGWAEVERRGWVRRSALPAELADNRASRPAKPARRDAAPTLAGGASAAPASQKPAPAPPPTAAGADTTPAAASGGAPQAAAGALTPLKSAGLSTAPGLPPVATVERGTVLTPLARDRGWVRVRIEGWMREADVGAADSAMARLSAADLRADPDAYVGRTVRWSVVSLAFQTADPLRKDMRPDEPYLLARGPGSESALLYLALPPDLVVRAKALSPMQQILITARVRTGKSDPAGVPILDVLTLTTN